MVTEIQALLFSKDKWSPKKAEDWLKQHNYHPIKERHSSSKYHRYRLIDPSTLAHKGFKKLRIKHLGDSIYAIMALK